MLVRRPSTPRRIDLRSPWRCREDGDRACVPHGLTV